MPMILADPRQDDCPIAFANNAFLDLTGYEEAEVLGRNCRFLQGAGTDPGSVRQLRDAVQDKRATALEILNYRRDGTPFCNAIFMAPVFDRQGELIYFFASQLDVSKRRESEQSLRQSQKMEAIGQLTAGLAHDFNNLLQMIDGSLERLKAKRFDDRAFERFHDVATAASARGAKLTRQLLAFARRTRLEPQGIDLTHLVNSFAELLDTSVGDKADLHLNLQRRLPQVRVDPNHLEMALLNVVVNARDASPDGGAITVTTRAIHLNGDAAARQALVALRRGVATGRDACGPITVLVNNAAHDERHRTEDVTPEYWDNRVAVNLRHQFFAAQAVLPDMKAAGGGAIVNFGSVSWMVGQGGMAAYTACKSAVLGLTRSLARDFGPDNIRVNAIAPGWIMTRRQKELWLTPEGERELMDRQCLKRQLQPDEIARVVLFLASEEASACTNQHYVVDGGWV